MTHGEDRALEMMPIINPLDPPESNKIETENLSWNTKSFEGVCVNYRNPGPRRGEPRVGSGPDVAFPVDPLDPLDPVQNSVKLIFIVKK